MKEKISDFIWKYFRNPVRNFSISVGNLIKWFPVIWKDRDWDHHFILEVIAFKLEKQSKYIKDKGFHTRSDVDSGQMMTCSKLAKRIQEDFYLTEYIDYVEQDFSFVPYNTDEREDYYVMESTTKSERFDEFFKKYPLVYKKILMDEKNQTFKLKNRDEEMDVVEIKQLIAMNISHYNHNRARKLLFSIMENNIERWWN